MPSEDSKPVKKEEVEDSVLQNSKKKTGNVGAKSRSPKLAKPKKEESDEEEEFQKPAPKRASNTTDKKKSGKVKKEEEKKKGAKQAEQNGTKRVRKVYDLPGQKRDPPEERDPLRIFYESLYEQVPGSEMAAFWIDEMNCIDVSLHGHFRMMESGLLSKEVASKVFQMKQKKNQQQKLSSPAKTVANNVKTSSHSVTVKRKAQSSPGSSQKKKTPPSSTVALKQSKKRKVEESDSETNSDDDFVLAKRVTKKQKAA